jgi:hypothetical protein
VNNVIYDWGTDASYSGPVDEGITKVNYVSNYLVAGPNTGVTKRNRAFNGGSVNTWIYQTGNVIDGNLNGTHDGTDTGWAMFVNLYTQQAAPLDRAGNENVKRSPEALGDITADTAQMAYTRVLAGAGNSRYRDPVDARIVSETQNETGLFINSQNDVGGFPLLNSAPAAPDTDGDGMSDAWENSHAGLNANDPSDAAGVAGNGYTNLENFLNRNLFAPTAASVSVSGRVTNLIGIGILKAKVTLVSSQTGQMISALTNGFGYYEFNGVSAGESYIISVSDKRYVFTNPAQLINVDDSISELNFVADQ